ncbi:stonustoxin subunit alpha-like [Cololabis saira]|uniref:stonustoxin subunit alpha-like n=1 Tax=Cololabis saira TaxID=129043 RepID=UPI002AD36CB2|nr:stonustoxin subunit alpha-like [Cololabis saira]
MYPYSRQLSVDTNTVNKHIRLSDGDRTMTFVEEEQPLPDHPDHPDRFDHWNQLLAAGSVAGRCYWEVSWTGKVDVAVSYAGIRRKGEAAECVFGRNDHSWCLNVSSVHGCSVRFNNRGISIPAFSSSPVSHRVAVYVDVPAGTLSFYKVVSDGLVHLHTFSTAFTQPLYPGFGFWPGSSVSL